MQKPRPRITIHFSNNSGDVSLAVWKEMKLAYKAANPPPPYSTPREYARWIAMSAIEKHGMALRESRLEKQAQDAVDKKHKADIEYISLIDDPDILEARAAELRRKDKT